MARTFAERSATLGFDVTFANEILTVRKAGASGHFNVFGLWVGLGICLLLFIGFSIVVVKALTAGITFTHCLVAIVFALPCVMALFIARRVAETLFARELIFQKLDYGNVSCAVSWPLSKRTLELRGPVVVRTYLCRMRSDWGFSINVEDANNQRVCVIIPTIVGDKAEARRESSDAGEYLAKCLGVPCESRA